MRQYFKPMLAETADSPFDSKDWIFEIKWDGVRAISYLDKDLSIRSRNNKELKYNFPELEELEQLTKRVVLDGEIVVMNEGKADFQKLLERSRITRLPETENIELPATYIVFDILEKDGQTVTNLPLMVRKKMLEKSLKEGKHIVLSVFVEGEGKAYYDAAIKRGVEGIMAKKKDSPYRPGQRSGSWLKIKKTMSCDCVIFGYTLGEGKRAGSFGALVLGLYDKDKTVFVGKVGTGFSKGETEFLVGKFKGLETNKRALEVVGLAEKITWLRPELVCEVKYQMVTRDGKLRIPRYRGLRIDKAPQECTLAQIKQSSLSEYVSKRDFDFTPEPRGEVKTDEGLSFVVQEHHARRLHYDLRLEKSGVLKSWAVPKGFPEKPGDRRLAVQTEDHPLEYANFEGTIPAGQYGAGTGKTWDRGSYRPKIWNDSKIEFWLNGEKLVGRYVLARFKKTKENEWLLLKARE
jgi:DNA ligase D-like protein (predicted ligase)/DNA ligase D-like protein (predicted 3'-phosphoesterase)